MEVLQKSKDTSITIQVDKNQDRQITDGGGSGGSMFSSTDQVDADHNSEESNPIDRAPEKRLTLFALRLAVLEKAASGLGTLGFVWATVVLLGGFAITLDKVDFWVITVILVIEGARIFSRSHELEWQHQSTRSSSIYSHRRSLRELESTCNTCNELRTSYSSVHGMAADKVSRETQPYSHDDDNHHNLVQRRWKSTEVPLLPYTGWFSLSSNISRVLYWLQLLSAIACVTLSLIRLIKQDYGEVSKDDSDKRNRKAALNIFYSLALAEALLFLSEKAYWEWKVRICNLLNEVNDACGFRQTDIVPIKRFFYDAFSKCINGSIFDGLKMDMVSFSEELLGSDSYDEQLIGARILLKFATKKEFAIETLRKIGTSSMTMERLLEMLNWKNPIEEELRMAAAMVVLRLLGKKQNTLRLAGIPGSLESISSLLNSKSRANSHRNGVVPHQQGIDFSAFNLIGLQILKKLVHDHDNCSKIGNTRGLLQKIIDFTGDAKRLLRENRESSTETQIDTMKYALQVVKMLASTSGPTGKVLRQEISEIVFTIINIRDILKYGENHMMLQQIAIEILRSLAMDEEAREKLGCTGGIVRELFVIFFKDALTDKQNSLRAEAGEALMMITLDNMENCKRILNQGFVDSLIQALNLQPSLMKNSARILRNMCAYIGAENLHHLRGIIAATHTVLKSVMEEEGRTLEATIGLAVQMFRFLSLEEFMNAGIEERDLAKKLIDILRKHSEPSYNLPRIRRFTIELAISMMKLNKMNIRFFKEEELKEELMNVADTTSELELFIVFSGSAGLSRHHTTMYTLVEDALNIMENSSRCEQGCISSRKK